MTKTCALTVLSLLTCLFTLAALGLNAYHFNGHLYYKDKTTDTVTRTTSSDTSDCPPALQMKIEGTNTVTGHEEVYIMSCPWKSYTRIIGIVTFSLCQFFAAIVCLKAKGKLSTGVLGFASFIALAMLIATIVLMVIDIINGHKQYPETSTSSYQPLTYILNIVFAFVGLLLGICCTILGFMTTGTPVKTSSGHQPTQTGNNSTIIGMNKSAGMEQDWRLYGNNKTNYNLPTSGNEVSYSTQRHYGPYTSNNSGPYTNNINSQATNKLTGGGTLTYQSNNRESPIGYSSNHRGHIGSHLNVGGGRRREEQNYVTNSIGSLTETNNNRNSLGYEGRGNRIGLRASNGSNHHNNYNYKSGGESNRVMPLAANYRGY